jgi:hypothetical protein
VQARETYENQRSKFRSFERALELVASTYGSLAWHHGLDGLDETLVPFRVFGEVQKLESVSKGQERRGLGRTCYSSNLLGSSVYLDLCVEHCCLSLEREYLICLCRRSIWREIVYSTELRQRLVCNNGIWWQLEMRRGCARGARQLLL